MAKTTGPTSAADGDLQALRTQVQRLTDEAEVRALAAAFSDACNRGDVADFRKLWTDDAVWEIGDPLPAQAVGIAAIAQMLEGLLAAWEFFVQMTHSGVVTIDGDHARARWTVQETARGRGGDRCYNNFALYEDEMVRTQAGWRFTRRKYDYIYLDDAELHGKSFRLPADLD